MAKDVTPIGPTASLSDLPDLHTMNPELRYAVQQWQHPSQAESIPRRLRLSGAAMAELQVVRQKLDRGLRPVSRRELMAWFGPLNVAFRNPLDKAVFEGRLNALADVIGNWPAVLFTVEARRELMAAHDYWPSVSDIIRVLQPEKDRLDGLKAALDTLAKPEVQSGQEAPRMPPTDEEKESVRAQLAALKADMQHSVSASAKPANLRPRPSFFNEDQLRRACEEQLKNADPIGRDLARARLAFLGKKPMPKLDDVA
jgi:hypothetical protein